MAAESTDKPVVDDDSGQRDTDTERVRTLGHDEFDPVGTAALIAVYFAILVVLWVFMYFVEFIGNGPTVVG